MLETQLCLHLFKPGQQKVELTEEGQFLIKTFRESVALHDRKEQEISSERDRLRQKMSQEALACLHQPYKLGKTNSLRRSIFDIGGSLRIKPFVFLREVEKLVSFELPLDKA